MQRSTSGKHEPIKTYLFKVKEIILLKKNEIKYSQKVKLELNLLIQVGIQKKCLDSFCP